MRTASLFCNFCLLLLVLVHFSCNSSTENKDPDVNKLRGRTWSASNFGKTWTTLKFTGILKGELKALTNPLTEMYRTYEFSWSMKGSDSMHLEFIDYAPITFRVYSVNDSSLVTNNWVNGPGDTTRLVFYVEGPRRLPQ